MHNLVRFVVHLEASAAVVGGIGTKANLGLRADDGFGAD